jgi:1-acyl-sn-glycerol-3-phosphate acyltransferase
MKVSERFMNALFRTLFRMFFRINLEELDKIPRKGPYLMMVNHTSALDGPMLYVFLQPMKLVALAKKQLWDKKFTGYVMKAWHSIPVDRDNMGRETMEACFSILDHGDTLAMAPEGTRSHDGNLQQGKAGIAFIAHKKQVPMVPVAVYGFNDPTYKKKLFRRRPITIAVGKPFEIIQKGGRLDATMRQEVIDEIMLRLAELMPKDTWGFYKDHTIEFKLTQTLQEGSLS